jgi:hypothetical protein
MSTLRELQAQIRVAMLDGDEREAAATVHHDELGPSARLAVYRHHVLTSLTAVLESTYPVVARLVDPRFFRFAADRYIRAQPPTGPCLFEYGGSFGDFLEAFEPTRHLAYLPDVARLEWAMNVALHAPDAAPIDSAGLRSGAAVTLHPSLTLITSPWPIDVIWHANQPDATDLTVDLGAGAVRLQVWRAGDDVVFRRLGAGALAVRDALLRTGDLEQAAEGALAADPAVDLTGLIRELLDEGILIGGQLR